MIMVSGEGVTDFGCLNELGPMLALLMRMLTEWLGYDPTLAAVCFVSKAELEEEQGLLKPLKPTKSLRLPGVKTGKETAFYHDNARALGQLARAQQDKDNAPCLAFLFRDADGTHSADRQHWQHKWDSILSGFAAANHAYGVPMLPKPKSEAWLLCALSNGYQGCGALEGISGNDDSPHAAKKRLAAALGVTPNRQVLCDLCDPSMKANAVDPFRIDMPSFNAFKACLKGVLKKAYGPSKGVMWA